jgi:phage major head subunit gpT-like protein
MTRPRKRDNAARAIRAAARSAEMIHAEAALLTWIEASAGEPDAPKSKRFSMNAYTGGLMIVSRYDLPVVIDLTGLKAEAPIPILRDHELSQVVGHADEVLVTASALKLSGVVSGAGPAAQEVVASASAGFPWRASVGAWPDKREFVGEGVKTEVNGKSFTGPLYIARKATLREVSFVAVGADSRTSAQVAASAAQPQEDDMNFHQWIEAMGLVVAELRDDQKEKLRDKYDAEVKATAKKDGLPIEAAAKKIDAPSFDLHAVALEYARHEAGIEAAAAKYADVPPAELAKFKQAALQGANEAKIKALEEKWPAARLEAEYVRAGALFERDLIRAERPKAPAIHGSTRDAEPQVIEAAFAMSCGLRSPEKHFTPQILEAASGSRFRRIGLGEVLLYHAIQAGYTGRMRVGADNLREVIRAAFSVHTLTTLLTTTGNKLLLEGFQAIPQTWREVAQVRPVADFKAVTAFRLTATLEYKELAPSGEIQHGTLGQESYTLQAKTYARMAALSRTDIINDDLGALNDLRNRFGIGAAVALNKVFWTAWTAAYNGAAFWTAARGNLVTGSALAEAGLNTAVKSFRNMAGPDGNMLNLEPDRLLVPPDLEATARKLYVSQEQRDTTASTKFPTTNIYFNRFRPVIVPELGNSAYTGYSATTWYLLSNPAVLASAIVCFLDGNESPTIETADTDFETLGIQFRGYHDFGCSMSEYRASVAAEA